MADVEGVGDLAEEPAALAEAFAREHGFDGDGARDYVQAMLASMAAATGEIRG